MQRFPEETGWIEVICGSMFSGKTEELISRIRREIYARKQVRIFKPRTDDRYAVGAVVSHSSLELPCVAVDHAADILRLLDDDLSVVGIDECQFFGEELLPVVESLANRGLRVICAGLDQDYLGRPFDPMPHLMAVAEYVTKKLAVCMVCGNPANRSQRLTASESRVVIGADDAYEARCRRCFHPREAGDQPVLPMTSPPALAPAAPERP
ncbi:MAG: thymidine kinase [Myxococcales bacterium]|nr:thymidine kinase [Myxococcales bacterium]MCB9547861.1 thymidine kinase [Myxococcales bacterium]